MNEERESWFITGASGLLGTTLAAELLAAGHRVVAARLHHPSPPGTVEVVMDLTKDVDISTVFAQHGITHVVHAAALTNVDLCETSEETACRLHVGATAAVARAAAECNAKFVMISTDQLWSDSLSSAATEERPPDPINVYGRTKAAGEAAALECHPDALVVRTNFFGNSTSWRRSSSDQIVDVVSQGGVYRGFDDVWFTPIGLPLLCRILIELVEGNASGIVHVGGRERVSKLHFAQTVVDHLGLRQDCIERGSVTDSPAVTAPRPHEMSLDSSYAETLVMAKMPSVVESLRSVYGPRRRRHDPEMRVSAVPESEER